MSPLISIIVPIYNTEKYLTQCIESILSQSYQDFELLLIDDGSTDSSGDICDGYSLKDSRIQVYHQSNGGASRARNLGISKAVGKWISFVDSDDYVSNDYLETFAVIPEKMDITFFPIKEVFANGDVCQRIPFPRIVKSRVEIETALFQLKYGFLNDISGWTVNKFYRRDIIMENHVQFPIDVTFRDDEIFMMTYCRYVKTLQVLDKPLYFYRILNTGLTSKGMRKSDFLALSNHLLQNIPFYQNEGLLKNDKKRIVDYRITNMYIDTRWWNLPFKIKSLYTFFQENPGFDFEDCSQPVLRMLNHPLWYSRFLIMIDYLLKAILSRIR